MALASGARIRYNAGVAQHPAPAWSSRGSTTEQMRIASEINQEEGSYARRHSHT